ncbi:MAG TPA: ORF6N domain-containing protein [Ferruginibacter sp.]|nr:ORF6N domain-containing protein [Ferruginibacter sp.]
MAGKTKIPVIPDELVITKIYLIREQKVMLDFDLSILYKVETKRLNEQVNRNIDRFPGDFMFRLTKREYENLRSQIATSRWGGTRYMPLAFTEQGVAMLSSVLNSPTAIAVNIQIIRVFTKMRALLLTHKDILLQLEKMEKKLGKHDEQIALVFEYLKKLLSPPQEPRPRIGFRRKEEED